MKTLLQQIRKAVAPDYGRIAGSMRNRRPDTDLRIEPHYHQLLDCTFKGHFKVHDYNGFLYDDS